MIKYFIITLFLASYCLAAPSPKLTQKEVSNLFENFMIEHKVDYKSTEEELYRFEVFSKNLEFIEQHNSQHAQKDGFEMAVNQFADRTPEEVQKIHGLRMPKTKINVAQEHTDYLQSILAKNTPVPDSFDWRQVKNHVSEVKNQLQCGSCWAFSTTGLLEGQEAIHGKNKSSNNAVLGLSEQELVDCSKSNFGCLGGIMLDALQDIAKLGGVETEEDYPYRARNGKCKYVESKTIISDKGGAVLDSKNEEELKKLVALYGPVAVAIHANTKMQFYKKGVFNDKHCNNKDSSLNHGVLVVGYGTDYKDGDYWIVKNSWGVKYGEKGYIRMSRNRKNQCGIASMPTIATF